MSYPTHRFRTTSSRKTGRGFTLVELMVTIAVAAVLLGIAIPSFETVFNSGRINGQANEFVATLQLARMEAIRRNSHVVVCDSADQTSCTSTATWTGWLAFVDTNSNGVLDVGEVVLRAGAINPLVKVQTSGHISAFTNDAGTTTGTITFRGDGLARDATGKLLDAIVSVCVLAKHPPQNIRNVVIGAGSRMSVGAVAGGGACAVPADK